MAEMFQLITPITYWILIALWSFILYFYVKKMFDSRTKQLFHVLVIILAIDAFRTLFESVYFGLWYTSLSGLIPFQIGAFLTRPELVIIPKIINILAAIIIIVLLLKRWLPKEEVEQNKLGAALHDRDEEFRALFEHNPVSCWLEDFTEVQKRFEILRGEGILDIDSYFSKYPEKLQELSQTIKIKDVNQATLDLHKAKNKEQLFQGLEKTFTPESFEVFRKEMIELWNGKIQNSHDGIVKTLDGELRYVQINYRVLPGYERTLEKVLISLVDNTAKWLAEQKLSISENRLDLAMQFTNDGLYDWNLESNEIFFSPGWKKMLGYEPEEIDNEVSVWEQLTHPDDLQASREMLNEVIEGKRPRFELEFRMKHKNGSLVQILSRANVDLNNEGKAIRVVGTHVNITEIKKYDNQLKVLNSAIDNSLNGFDIVNADGLFIYVNKALVRMYGYDRADEFIGTSPVDLCVDPQIPEKVIQELQKNGEYEFEHEAKKRDGSTFDILMFARLAHDEQGNEIYPTTCIDITERKRSQIETEKLQRQLQHARQMESIGNLAGGIAHDFNNILASILGFSELALDDVEKGSIVEVHLQEIHTGGLRAKEIVKQILAFSRQSGVELKATRVDTIIIEALKLIRPSTPTTIEIQNEIESSSLVMGNATQIHQIIMNLCTNAIHAMHEDGGVMEVLLKDTFFKENNGKIQEGLKKGNYIELAISDNGCGIAPEHIDSIFDPYFTTKETGKGTGMGLAMVRGIIDSYGGHITVESNPFIKTVLSIYLPVTGNLDNTIPSGTDEPLVGGDESILFVDDEPSIVRMGSRMLENLGYTVTSRTSSLEALELFRTTPDRFTLVITDMTMPHMTGDKFALELKRIRDDIRIILCTGYSNKISEEIAHELGINAFTYKPFSKADLASTVREVLDKA